MGYLPWHGSVRISYALRWSNTPRNMYSALKKLKYLPFQPSMGPGIKPGALCPAKNIR